MRLFINFTLKAGVIILLNWLGWITLRSSGHAAEGPKEIVSAALIGAVIFTLVSVLLLLFSFGLAALLSVFFGWAILEIMNNVAPDLIGLNPNVWLTVLSGFLIFLARPPKQRKRLQVQ